MIPAREIAPALNDDGSPDIAEWDDFDESLMPCFEAARLAISARLAAEKKAAEEAAAKRAREAAERQREADRRELARLQAKLGGAQ